MDDLFGKIDSRSKSESIVMRLLRSAMDKAHENVQSMNGPLEFLHERSKFYEFAAILVDGGLNIVEEEADIYETNREMILSDLMEIKDWLEGRNEEMRLLIMEKDKELMERVETELKLRQSLELNERELVYLREKLELERSKSEGFQDFLRSNLQIQDETKGGGGDICELKNSVDQQVLNIKQKLEDERKSLTSWRRRSMSNISDTEIYSKLIIDEDRSPCVRPTEDHLFSGIKPLKNTLRSGKNNLMIRQMSSDIDILKGTLDLAFGRMQNAEVFPLEKQWSWTIEKDAIIVSIKGFINDIQQIFDAEFRRKECLAADDFCGEKWTEFFDDITALRNELKDFCSQNKLPEQRLHADDTSGPSRQILRMRSEPLPEVKVPLPEEDLGSSGSHVTKMIKNHETIIQKHSPEWKWMTREVLQINGPSLVKREKELDNLETRIHKAIAELDNLISWKDNPGDEKGLYFQNCSYSNRSLIQNDINGPSVKETTDDHGITPSDDHCKQKAGELEETISCKFPLEFLESAIREDVFAVYFQETIKEWNKNMECNANDCLVKDTLFKIVLSESLNSILCTSNLLMSQQQVEVKDSETTVANISCSTMSPESVRSLLKEDIYMVYFREQSNAWNMEIHDYDIEILIREDIIHLVIVEAVTEARANFGEPEMLEKINVANFFYSPSNLDIQRGESFIEKLDSLLKHYEEDDYLMVSKSSQTNEQNDVILKFEDVAEKDNTEWLWIDDENTFDTVSEKLETALNQLYTSKVLLSDMEHNLGMTPDKLNQDDHPTQLSATLDVEYEKKQDSCCQQEENKILQQNPSIFSPLTGFEQEFLDFENLVDNNLESKCLRVEELKQQIATLVQPVASMRRRKLLYKKAFETRCRNLQLAETEVDLLANQVDKLQCLLQKIYLKLNQNSTVMSHYFEVSDLLKLIKKELAEGAACTRNL